MLRKLLATVGFMGIVFATVSCGERPIPAPTPTPEATPSATGTIVLGDVSSDPFKKINLFQPLADYLAANLGEFGIGIGEVKIAPDIKSMTELIKSGKVDIYFDSLYPAMIISDKSGAKPILRRWKKGKADYSTVFFTRADSGITSLDDLQGKKIGFQTKSSTSGFFLPLVYLLENDLNPVEKERDTSPVTEDEVGYVFTGNDENTIQWVVSGKLVAGATDNRSFMQIPEESRTQLTILAETEKIARQVVMLRADMEPELQVAIKTLLMELDRTPEGKKVLETFEKTTRFDELPQESGWERMQELYTVFESR